MQMVEEGLENHCQTTLSLSLSLYPHLPLRLMENIAGSSSKSAVPSKGKTADPEESGWTAYFEDFFSKQKDEDSSFSDSLSMVSDAASNCVPWKINNTNDQATVCPPLHGSSAMPEKLGFKKARKKETSRDDSLEDTACFPANSPKIGSGRQVDVKARKGEDDIETTLGKGGGTHYFCSELQTEKEME
ncbi:hypothetical protein NMG60_11035458 [Bertholletia excelsa]